MTTNNTVAEVLGRIAHRLDEKSLALTILFVGEAGAFAYDISSLAATLGKPRATVKRIIDPLILSGSIRTKQDAADKRRTILELTIQGRRQAAQYVDQMATIVLPIIQNRMKERPRYIRPRKSTLIPADEATPLIKKSLSWASSSPESVPLHLMERIFIIEPDTKDFAQSKIKHWGNSVWDKVGQPRIEPRTMSQIISQESKDFSSLAIGQFEGARSDTHIHRIEIEVIMPDGRQHYDVYHRVAMYHPSVGIISCLDFVQWTPRN